MEFQIFNIPFGYRFVILILFLTIVAVWDYYWHPQSATPRWKEFLFLLIVGTMGGLFGLFNDCITSSISPQYFILGKGIGNVANWRLNSLLLGAKAGFVAAIFAGCLMLYLNNPKPGLASMPQRALLRLTWKPLLISVLFGVILGISAYFIAPVSLLSEYRFLLNDLEMKNFLIVWAIHNGLYLGLYLSLCWLVFDIRKMRKKLAINYSIT
jgi:hypothetical protein